MFFQSETGAGFTENEHEIGSAPLEDPIEKEIVIRGRPHYFLSAQVDGVYRIHRYLFKTYRRD
jgi:hypothetical protein